MRLFFCFGFHTLFFFFYPLFRTIFWSDCFWFQTFWCQMSAEREGLSRSSLSEMRQSVAGEKHFAGHVQMDKWVPNFVPPTPPPHSQEKQFCLGSRRKQHHNGRFYSSKESTKWNTVNAVCASWIHISVFWLLCKSAPDQWMGFYSNERFCFLKTSV